MNNPSTLATMMRVSRRMYEVAAPRLYCEVDMTYNNAKRLYPAIGLADVMGKGKSMKSGDGKEINKQDVGNTALTDTTSDISLPFSKRELLSMINHLNIHDIPSSEDCECLASIATAQIIPRSRRPITISIRPYAAYLLMANRIFQHSHRYHEPQMFLLFLRELHWEHLCIQLPVMDKDVEDDHSRFRSDAWEHKDKARDRLREALTQHDEKRRSGSGSGNFDTWAGTAIPLNG